MIVERQQVLPTPMVAVSSTTSAGQSSTSALFPTPTQTGKAPKSSSLYLFTFLITLVVLACIIGALIFRSIVLRRRFQRRVEEAIARGERPPERTGGMMGTQRTKPRIRLGPKPEMWETEMLRKDDVGGELMHQIEPLSITHPLISNSNLPLSPLTESDHHQSRTRRFANLFQSDTDASFPVGPSRRPTFPPRNDSTVTPTPPSAPDIPPRGTPLTVSVMIALPSRGDGWRERDEGEDVDVPNVILGIATVKLA